MKKRLLRFVSLALSFVLFGGLLPQSHGAETDSWSIGSGWTETESPIGDWLEYTGSGASSEGVQYLPEITDSLRLSYYVSFKHASQIVDCHTITLRKKGTDERFFLRIKGCNNGILLEGQYYDGTQWTDLFSTPDWIQNVGTFVTVNVSWDKESDTLDLSVLSGGIVRYENTLSSSAFLPGNTPLVLQLGCEEGNLALTNLRIDPQTVTPSVTDYFPADARQFLGAWTVIQPEDSADGMLQAFSNSKGASWVIGFYGNSFRWIGSKGPIYGEAKITIDGEVVATVDCYAPQTENHVVCYEKTDLTGDGMHLAQITVLGSKNVASENCFVSVGGSFAEELLNYDSYGNPQWEQELENIASGNRYVSDPADWTPVENAANVPASGVTLGEGPLSEAYDRFMEYLLHCWGSNQETEIFRAVVNEDKLSSLSRFLSGDLFFSFGGYGSQNGTLRDISFSGGGSLRTDDWYLSGESWMMESQAGDFDETAIVPGYLLDHSETAGQEDSAVLKDKLSGSGFAVSFVADFSEAGTEQSLYMLLDAEDGQKLSTRIIAGQNGVFGTEGYFIDGDWSGLALRAQNWVGNPTGKVKITLSYKETALTVTMEDLGGDPANCFTTTMDGSLYWTLPGFYAKGMRLSFYGGKVKLTDFELDGQSVPLSAWDVGEGWSAVEEEPVIPQLVTALKHSGTDSHVAKCLTSLAGENFAVEFVADFSATEGGNSMYFTLGGADGSALTCQMICDRSSNVFGIVANVGDTQVYRAENWLPCDTGKTRVRIENPGDGTLVVTVFLMPKTALGNTYCDGVGWTDWLPASNDGRMLMGAANALRWGEDETLRSIVDTIVANAKAQMRADGFYGYYSDVCYNLYSGGDSERKNYDRVFWTRGMLAAGAAGNEDAYALVREMYDWFNSNEYLDRIVDGSNATNGFPGGPLVAASPVGTAEDLLVTQRYYDLEFLMDAFTAEDPLSFGYYPGERPHTYMLLILEAMLEEYRLTGDERYLNALNGAWNVYKEYYMHAGGATAICEEHIGAFPPNSYFLDKHTGETCGSVFWVNINSKLLQLYPTQEKYAAEIERSLYNVLLAAQDEKGYISYHNNLQRGKDGAGCSNVCCEVSSTDLYARLPELIFSVADQSIYVNLYASAIIDHQGFGLRMDTDFPNSGEVSLAVTDSGQQTIYIRIPSWANASVAIMLNGEHISVGEPGTYVALDRCWSEGDVVSFLLPMELHLEKYEGLDQVACCERYAVLYGPVLLALESPMQGVDGIPAIAMNGEELLSGGLIRQEDSLTFVVQEENARRFVPYWQISRGSSFTCFPILGAESVDSDSETHLWDTDEINGVKDFSGWSGLDGMSVSAVYDQTTGNHRIWKNLIADQNNFTVYLDITAQADSSAYIKVLGQTLELDARNGNGAQLGVKLNGSFQTWVSAENLNAQVYLTRVDGGDIVVTVVTNGKTAKTEFTLTPSEDSENVELGLYAGTVCFADITVTEPDPEVEMLKNPGDFGWESDSEDFSGWTATDAANLSVTYAQAANGRVWKGLLADQNNFTIDLDVTNDNTSSTYIKVLGVTIELDSNNGDGNQTFMKVNGTNYDWLAGQGCKFHVNITRENGGNLLITVTGEGNAAAFTSTATPTEANENVELGLYRGISKFENIAVVSGASAPTEKTIKIGHTVSFDSDLRVNYRVKYTDLTSALPNYVTDGAYLVVEKDLYLPNGTMDVATTTLYPDLVTDANRMVFSLGGIQSVEMGSELRAVLHVFDADGNEYYTPVDIYSVLTYASSNLSSTTNAAFRTLLVDLLNYGASAQLYFGRNTDNLVNAGIDAYQQYATTELSEELNDGRTYIDNDREITAVTAMGFSVVFADKTEMIAKLTLADGYTKDDITCVKVLNSKGVVVDTITNFTEASDGRLQVTYYGVKSIQMREMFQFVAYVGDKVASQNVAYSVEAYVKSNVNSANTKLADMVLKCIYYGDSAKAYFDSLQG